MAKKNAYKEEGKPLLTILYFIVVLVLIADLVFLYDNWKTKTAEFGALVRQASAAEGAYRIEERKRLTPEETQLEEEQAKEEAELSESNQSK